MMLYNFLALVQSEKNNNDNTFLIVITFLVIAVISVIVLKSKNGSNSYSRSRESKQILVDNDAHLAENDLNALKEDFENGFISKQEYERLKAEIIDKL